MSARLWLHQGVLVLVAGVLLIVASLLVGWAGELLHQDPLFTDREAVRRLTWAITAAGVATAALLVAAVFHAFRVLSLTFKGAGEPQ